MTSVDQGAKRSWIISRGIYDIKQDKVVFEMTHLKAIYVNFSYIAEFRQVTEFCQKKVINLISNLNFHQ